MGRIATEKEACLIGTGGIDNPSSYTDRLCVTRARAETLGCSVPDTYKSNQLVEYADLARSGITLTGTIETGVSAEINGIHFNPSLTPQPFSINVSEPYMWEMGISSNEIYEGGIDLQFTCDFDVEIKLSNYHYVGVSQIVGTNGIFIGVGSKWDPNGTISGDITLTLSTGEVIYGHFNYL